MGGGRVRKRQGRRGGKDEMEGEDEHLDIPQSPDKKLFPISSRDMISDDREDGDSWADERFDVDSSSETGEGDATLVE